jgi:hypothetical protein
MESKRRSPRTVLNKILCIQIGPNNHAIVVDISDDGLGSHAVYPVTDSGLIHFSFRNPVGRRVESCAELVWTDPTKKSGGLRFVYLPKMRREPLRNWIVKAQMSASPDAPDAPAQAPASSRPREDTHRPIPAREPPPPAAHWPLHPPSQPPPRPSAFPAPQSATAAPRPAEQSVAHPSSREQPRVAPAVGPPPSFTSELESDGPGFVLLGKDLPPDAGHRPGPQMTFPGPRSSFFTGFFTGAIFSAIVSAILLYAYGNPVRHLQTLVSAWRKAAPAAQLGPTAPPPASAQPRNRPHHRPRRQLPRRQQRRRLRLPPAAVSSLPALTTRLPEMREIKVHRSAMQALPTDRTRSFPPPASSLPPAPMRTPRGGRQRRNLRRLPPRPPSPSPAART